MIALPLAALPVSLKIVNEYLPDLAPDVVLSAPKELPFVGEGVTPAARAKAQKVKVKQEAAAKAEAAKKAEEEKAEAAKKAEAEAKKQAEKEAKPAAKKLAEAKAKAAEAKATAKSK